jgi:ASC-1-like (ASCH) protein
VQPVTGCEFLIQVKRRKKKIINRVLQEKERKWIKSGDWTVFNITH